ncbi:MAG TPA: hypothetical protein VLV16_02140 [Gemmatimonadales bacterium]|nr:hypothetical protein [Gemmatimonadales bacterium]
MISDGGSDVYTLPGRLILTRLETSSEITQATRKHLSPALGPDTPPPRLV